MIVIDTSELFKTHEKATNSMKYHHGFFFFFNHSKKKKKSETLHPATVTTCMLMEETPFAGNDGVKSLTLDLGTIRGAQVLRTLHVFFFFLISHCILYTCL